MAAQPRMTVTGPTLAPLAYGLLPHAVEQTRTEDHARAGVEYETLSGVTGGVQPIDRATMAPTGVRTPETLDENSLPLVAADPFLIYAGVQAKVVGLPVEAQRERARAKLQLTAGHWIERGFFPSLQSAAPVHAETPAAVDPDIAIGLLEEWIADTVGAQGLIHAPRRGIGVLAKLTGERSGKRFSPLGTPVAFGSGYRNQAPTGVAAAAGVVWLYASGPVTVSRSGIDPLPEGGAGAAMTLPQNLAVVYATEVVSVGFEAGAIAVPVKFEVENP